MDEWQKSWGTVLILVGFVVVAWARTDGLGTNTFGDALAPLGVAFAAYALLQAATALRLQQTELKAVQAELTAQREAQQASAEAQNRLAAAQEAANTLAQMSAFVSAADQFRGSETVSALPGQAVEGLVAYAIAEGMPPFAPVHRLLKPIHERHLTMVDLRHEDVNGPLRPIAHLILGGWHAYRKTLDNWFENHGFSIPLQDDSVLLELDHDFKTEAQIWGWTPPA